MKKARSLSVIAIMVVLSLSIVTSITTPAYASEPFSVTGKPHIEDATGMTFINVKEYQIGAFGLLDEQVEAALGKAMDNNMEVTVTGYLAPDPELKMFDLDKPMTVTFAKPQKSNDIIAVAFQDIQPVQCGNSETQPVPLERKEIVRVAGFINEDEMIADMNKVKKNQYTDKTAQQADIFKALLSMACVSSKGFEKAGYSLDKSVREIFSSHENLRLANSLEFNYLYKPPLALYQHPQGRKLLIDSGIFTKETFDVIEALNKQ